MREVEGKKVSSVTERKRGRDFGSVWTGGGDTGGVTAPNLSPSLASGADMFHIVPRIAGYVGERNNFWSSSAPLSLLLLLSLHLSLHKQKYKGKKIRGRGGEGRGRWD